MIIAEDIYCFKGRVVRKVWGDGDYKIYAMNVDERDYPFIQKNRYGNVTITGEMIDLDKDVDYEITAVENDNIKYGISYNIRSIHRDKPTTGEEVYAFLKTVLTNNQANELYREYPNIIDMIMHNEKVDFGRLKGIKERSFEKVKKKVIDNFELFETIAKFQHSMSNAVIHKLHKHYGSTELIEKKLSEAPYECLCQLPRTGFIMADIIIKKIEDENKFQISRGFKPIISFTDDIMTSRDRCLFCIIHILDDNEEKGNTYIELQSLKNQLAAMAPECQHHMMDCLTEDPRINYDRDNGFIAKRYTYFNEVYVANAIKCGLEIKNVFDVDNFEKYRECGDIILSDEQFSVLKMLCEHNICILNGSAGSGKTQTIISILEMLRSNDKTYSLMAPTGKAAKVIREYTGEQATTIHIGLGYNASPKWDCNPDNPIQCDVVIVDEVSMIDISLMRRLLEAIDFSQTKLLLVGDDAQLPSIGCGNVLHDLMESNIVPTVTLTKIFRYGDGGLMTVATDIRKGKKYLNNITSSVTKFGTDGDYYFINTPKEGTVEKVINVYRKALSSGVSQDDIQILTAMKVGALGSQVINNKIQKIVNPNAVEDGENVMVGNVRYYKGDIVIQTVNNYKATLYDANTGQVVRNDEFIANGETGRIIDISGDGEVYIKFDNLVVIYDREQMSNVDLGYCITVHKSQGSSAKFIILSTPSAHTFMLNSNLLYVGVTRTKKRCFHIGEVDTINQTIWRKENFNRMTRLKEFLLDDGKEKTNN